MNTDTTQDPFQILDRTHDDFAASPVAEAFNWAEFAAETNLTHWYMVAFRSTRKPTANLDLLDDLETLAYNDALEQPGFIFYFKGKVVPGAAPNQNMSFCMWRDRASAVAASRRHHHAKAAAVANGMYDVYQVERYNATVHRSDAKAWVEFDPLTV